MNEGKEGVSGAGTFPTAWPHELSSRVAACGGCGVAWCVKRWTQRESVAGLDIIMRAGGKQRAVDKKAKGLGLQHPPNCRPSSPSLYIHEACVVVVVGRGWRGGRDTRTKRRAAHIESLGEIARI